jgi:hypothetical protein
MFKFIKTFDDYDTPILPYNFNVTKEGIENLADGFLKDLGKDYDLRKGKPFDKKKGNCAWFTESFYEWCEINNIPARIIYFPETEKAKDAHIAILIDDFVLDFAYKQFSKDKDQVYKISKLKEYSKLGYDPGKTEVVDEFPSWIDDIYPLDAKK